MALPDIYAQLEARYTPPALGAARVLLVRASVGENADTPYREIYRDEDFGWRRVAERLEIVDVVGGHASMLQERFVDSIATVLVGQLGNPPFRPDSQVT